MNFTIVAAPGQVIVPAVKVDAPLVVVAAPGQVIIPAVKVDAPLVVAGIQGPPGVVLPGMLSLVATTDIGGGRAINASGGYAGETAAIGVTTQAVTTGGILNVMNLGELNGFSGLTPGNPIYLGLNGVITQTPVTTGIHQQLGVAKTSSTIIIQIQQSVRL